MFVISRARKCRPTLIWYASALVIAPLPGFAQNSFYISPDFSYTKPDSDQYRSDDFGFGLAIGAPLTPTTDVEMH